LPHGGSIRWASRPWDSQGGYFAAYIYNGNEDLVDIVGNTRAKASGSKRFGPGTYIIDVNCVNTFWSISVIASP